MKRRAFSLLEVGAAVTIGAALMAIAAGQIHSLLTLDRRSRDDVRAQASRLRLAEQFRADAHAAAGLAPAGDAAWRFDLGGGRAVEYRVEAETLVRLDRQGETVQRRESFLLPPDPRASLETAPLPNGKLAVLRIAAAAPPERPLRVEAVLDYDRRFARRPPNAP